MEIYIKADMELIKFEVEDAILRNSDEDVELGQDPFDPDKHEDL